MRIDASIRGVSVRSAIEIIHGGKVPGEEDAHWGQGTIDSDSEMGTCPD